MTTSKVTEHESTGAAIVERAFNHIRVKQQGQNLEAPDAQLGLDVLNDLLKSWQRDGLHLWKDKEAALFLQPNRRVYTVGKQLTQVCNDAVDIHTTYGTIGDWVNTTTTAAALVAQPVIDITSLLSYEGVTFDTSCPMYLGVENEDGGLDWYTVSSVSTLEITLTTNLTTAVDSGAVVYIYYQADQIPKPLKIYEDNIRLLQNVGGYELPLNLSAWTDYNLLPQKDTSGTPSQVFYSPKIDNTRLAIWPISSSVKNVLLFRMQSPFDIFNVGTNTQDAPSEWIRPLAWALAAELGQAYGIRTDRQAYIDQKAAALYSDVLDWDQDNASIFIQPEYQ